MSDQSLDSVSLQRWLISSVPGFAPPFTLSKFESGQSNPTYRIEAQSGDYVLRRKPFGTVLPSAHAVDREFRLLSSLHPTGFPVPQPLAECDDPGVIGSRFYVMELVRGYSVSDGRLPGLTAAERESVYMAMTDTLARLHSVNLEQTGLADFGSSQDYLQRQISRWTRQYRLSETDFQPEMERLIQWLPATAPRQTRRALVHGDFRIDNIIFGPDWNVRALLDWELSTVGDPMADFAYFAMQWVLPADGKAALSGLDLETLGIPSRDAILARYRSLEGHSSPPSLEWYFAYNLFRLAAIVQGIKKRALDGSASNPAAEATGARVGEFAELAWQQALAV